MPEFIERISVNYENLSEKYMEQVSNYNKQYCSIYLTRLNHMMKLLNKQIEKKWGNTYPVCKLHKLSEENHPKCIVMGTLFKDQKLKPSILKQLAEGNQLVPQPILTHFTDKSDELFIEDELQRYKITGTIQSDLLVTGITCALLGTDDGKGKIIVEDCIFANYQPQIPRPTLSSPFYIVFISGLDLIHSENFTLNLQLLSQWLSGFISNLHGIETSKIARVIIAGNSIRIEPETLPPSISMLSRRGESNDSIETAKVLDEFLLDLCKVDVDVMPGENDPSNHILPQKPMHHCMFPKSSAYKTVNHVSNPYYCSLGGVKILGASGQLVKDIMGFSEVTDPLDALESCLKWSHLAPTAPDTLGCFPYYESDPFVLEECPHVLFTGNSSKFSTKEVKGPDEQRVRLVCIPQFGTTLEVCVLNLQSLDCVPISFKTF